MNTNSYTPYKLIWPKRQYERLGQQLGFHFKAADFEQARHNGHVLGIRRYLPRKEAPQLGIPPGVLVECVLEEVSPLVVGVDTPDLEQQLKEVSTNVKQNALVLVGGARRKKSSSPAVDPVPVDHISAVAG